MMDIQSKKDSHIGALFPRVHVSETKVPGPRAPPRNKMGLFEQFTIPPQSFVPPLVLENSSKVTSQGGGEDISSGLLKPKQVKLGELSSKESDVSCRKAKCRALRCSVAEVHSETLKSSAACDSGEINCSSLPARHASPPNSLMQKLWSRSTEESDVAYDANLSSTDIRTQHSTVESRPVSLSTKRMAMPPCGWTGIGVHDTNNLHALFGADAENNRHYSAGATGDKGANSKLLVGSADSNVRSAGISWPREAQTHMPKDFRDEGIHDCMGASDRGSLVQQFVCSDRSSEVAGHTRQQTHITPLQKCDGDRWNSDSLPRIVPKHVIAVIGQREFWEARTTMLQQQKTLSMQVFELHRLIEVQRLIAAKPGLLLEGKDKCYVVKASLQPAETTKGSNKLVTKESLNKETRQCTKPKQPIVKEPKKHVKLSPAAANTQNPSLQLLPLKPSHASLDQSRVSTWAIRPGSHNYGICRSPMAFGPPSLGHLYNEQQVLQSGSYVFANGSRPCDFSPKFIPEVYNPPLAFQNFVNGSVVYQMGCAPGAFTSESLPTLNQATSSPLNPSLCAQHNQLNTNSRPEACGGTDRKRSFDCTKRASQAKKSTRDLDAIEKVVSVRVAGSCEFGSKWSDLGSQTFCKMASTTGDKNEALEQPAKVVVDMVAATESDVAHGGGPVSPEKESFVEKGEKHGVAIPKVIRAVPRPASEAVKAAAKILKSLQESESSRGLCLQ